MSSTRKKSPKKPSSTAEAMRAAARAVPKPAGDQGDTGQPAPKPLKDKVMQTIYMPFGVHEALRAQAFHERCSQQQIIRRAVEAYLKRPWDEMAKITPPEEPELASEEVEEESA